MADLNALIAQGVQFKEPPNPFAQYAQMQQLQQGAQQNQMNQLLMQEKQRGFQEQNSLRSLMAQPGFNLSNPEHQRAVQTVAPNLADTLIKNHLANVEMQGKITAQPGEQAFKAAQTSKFTAETTELANKTKREGLKQAISDISKFDNAADALKDLDVHEREGKIPPEKAAQMRAVLSDPSLSFSKWQRSTVMGLMDEKDRVEATRPKPVATQLGNRVMYQDMNPDSPTFKQEILPSQMMGATPSTTAALEQARAATSNAATAAARLKWEQDNPGFSVHMTDQGPVAVNNKDPSKVKQITFDGQPLGKPLANIPATANKAMISNEQNLSLAKTALALAEGKTVGEVKGDIAATGWKGVLSDEMLQRMDPEGVNTRAYIADLGSMIVHDRSGAAVTASEMPRLKPFIPKSTDTAEAVQDKLKRFIRAFEQENNLYNETYSKEQGYHPRSKANALTAAAPADKQALDWANANPTDPRAAQIKQRLGVR